MHPRAFQSNPRENPPGNQTTSNLNLSRTITNERTNNQAYQSFSNQLLSGQNTGNAQNTPRTPNTQFFKGSDRFAQTGYHQSSRSVNPSYTSNTYIDTTGLQRSVVKPLRYDESQVHNQTILSLQNSTGQLHGQSVNYDNSIPRTSYISQKNPQPSPRVMTQPQFSNINSQNPRSNDIASKLAENQEFRTSTVDELEALSREELIIRLRNSETIISELKKMIGSLRSGMNEKDEVFKLSRQVQDLTNELVGLREQNFKLKNLANDELLILEKVETKEVYGKKSKVQEELDQARKMKVEYENLLKSVQQKETVITTHEKEIIELKTVIDRTNNQLNSMRRVHEEIKSGTYNSQEVDQLKRELDARNGLLARKDKEMKDEQAKSSSYLKNIMDLNKQIEAMKNGLTLKQNELDTLRRELNKPAQVVVERVIPQEIQQELQQLRSNQILKDKEITSLSQNLNGSTQKIKEMEIQISSLHNKIKDSEKSLESASSHEKKEINELRARVVDLQKQIGEKDRTIFEHEAKRQLFDDMRNRLSVLEAMLDERNKYIVILEAEKRGTVSNEEFNSLLQKAREIEAIVREREREIIKKSEMLEMRDNQIREQADQIGQLKAQLNAQGPMRSSITSENSMGLTAEDLLRKRNQQLEQLLQDKTRELNRVREEITNFKIPGDVEVNDGKIPAELNKIVIEQQRAKLDNYKNMVEGYQKDIDNLKNELDYLRKHDGNEGAYLRAQLELKNSEISHLHRTLQELKISNAELEATLKTLKEQMGNLGISPNDPKIVFVPKITETHITERYTEHGHDITRNSNRRVTQDFAEDDADNIDELRVQKKRLEEQRRKDTGEIRELKSSVGKLEFELEQLANDNTSLEKQIQSLRDELKRRKKEFDDISASHRDLESRRDSFNPEEMLFAVREDIRKLLENSSLDKAFIKKTVNTTHTIDVNELLRRIFEQVAAEKSGLKKQMLSEGVQTTHSQKSESTQTEFDFNNNINMRFASPISRSNRSQFEMKDLENYQKLEEELEDLKAKYIEQVNLNQKMGEKNVHLLEENAAMRDQLKEMKEKKSEYKKIVKKTFKEGDDRKNFDTLSRISVDDNQQGLKMLLEEIQRLKQENGDLLAKYNALREQIVKRKKALLNELSNFVNTKNNFENSFFSEITRTSTTEVIIIPH